MITINELMELRMQQQVAHEILYRQQIMQRLPDPFAAIMPALNIPQNVLIPCHPHLPGVEAKLENNELWQQFHKIGTEMIITKSGRRMFPSMRVTLKGLEDESQYCVLVEMIPMEDCRYKFSGSQWIPTGGAEPQSPQRIYLHPDSPATGSHWQAEPILFNKVKLTNNTLDNNGHIVLASMHKYQPRIHVIRTNDLSQIPWAPQVAFVFPETDFVAVTAYQNDRITKLKIDNNPFAKGFRETGQSKCKRKLSLSPAISEDNQNNSTHSDDDLLSSAVSSRGSPQAKRLCMNRPYMDLNNVMRSAFQPNMNDMISTTFIPQLSPQYMPPMCIPALSCYMEPLSDQSFSYHNSSSEYDYTSVNEETSSQISSSDDYQTPELFVDVVSTCSEESEPSDILPATAASCNSSPRLTGYHVSVKRNSFSISSILGNTTARNALSV